MDTDLYTQIPPAARCAATTRHGLPCQGPALEHAPFCAFHDPYHAQAVAAGRARGGAAPRRRTRRLPRRLDYLQVADLTGELFVEALNHVNPADPHSLRAVAQLARLLLHAVGRPKDSFVPPGDAAEPAADAPHLLRIYPPLAPGVEALLTAEAPAPPRPVPAPEFERHADYHFQPDRLEEPNDEQADAWLDADDASATPGGALAPAETAEYAPDPTPDAALPPAVLSIAGADLAPVTVPPDEPRPEPEAGQWMEQRGGQEAVQRVDREWTGQLATESFAAADLVPAPASMPSAAPDLTPPAPAAGPAFALPRSLVYLRPLPRDPFG